MKKITSWLLIISTIIISACSSLPGDKSASNEKELDSLLVIGKMTPGLLWKLGRVGEIALSPDGKSVLYGLTYYDAHANQGNTDLYTLPVSGGTPRQLTHIVGNESNGIHRPDGNKIGFISNKSGSFQIWEMDPDGNFQRQVSKTDGDINGFLYSPNSGYIVYAREVKLDKTPQEIYPDLPKTNVRIINDLMYRHWDSWFDYTYTHLFVSRYHSGKLVETIDIMEGEPFDAPVKPYGGMEQISWSPDGKKLAYTCKKLKGREYALSTNTDIYLYDLGTRKTTNLSKEMPGYDQDPVFSPDGKKIVWRSMKTPGYESDKDRIMLFDLTTNQIKDCSASFDQSASNFQWSKDGNTLFFISGVQATFQIYKLSLATGEIRALTVGDHDYTNLLVAGDKMVATRMSMSQPVEIFTIDFLTGKEVQLSFTNRKILDKIQLAKVEKRWIKTTDGKDMLTWVILPPGFDPSKKYPALLYCQGGPQSAVSQFFSYRWNFQMMAANNYIVVAPNRRGLPTFGQEWNDQIACDYGGQNMQDYLSAIDEVSKEPYVDKEHLGAVGASYGGYSVFWLAGHHDKRFKAFISHCGMYNLESQYGATEEYFFVNHDLGGPYWQTPKPKSYEYSPHLSVGNWDTPILIITGGRDFRIPYTESMQAFNAAQLRGIPSKLLFFPEESHFILKPQNSILWQREFFGWLDQWLKS